MIFVLFCSAVAHCLNYHGVDLFSPDFKVCSGFDVIKAFTPVGRQLEHNELHTVKV